MTQTNNRFFDEMARLMNDAAGVAQGVRREFDTLFRTQAERILRELDVVQREEFEAVKEMARLAREENEALKSAHRGAGREGCRQGVQESREPAALRIVIPGRAEGANPESRNSTESASGFRVRSFGPARNDKTGPFLPFTRPAAITRPETRPPAPLEARRVRRAAENAAFSIGLR